MDAVEQLYAYIGKAPDATFSTLHDTVVGAGITWQEYTYGQVETVPATNAVKVFYSNGIVKDLYYVPAFGAN